MGVYIKGRSKPKSCYTCTFRIIDPTDGSVCGCVVGHIQGIPLDQDRADDCPLIEIDLVRCEECEWSNGECSVGERYQGGCTFGERRTDETQP